MTPARRFRGICFATGLSLMVVSPVVADGKDDRSPHRHLSSEQLQTVRSELGVHYGAPLRLSAHASYVWPMGTQSDLQVEGFELAGEVGAAGVQASVGWAKRSFYYYSGTSWQLGVLRTWDAGWRPLGVPADATFAVLSGRLVGVGLTLRLQALHRLDGAVHDRWSLGWSVGVSW